MLRFVKMVQTVWQLSKCGKVCIFRPIALPILTVSIFIFTFCQLRVRGSPAVIYSSIPLRCLLFTEALNVCHPLSVVSVFR